MQQQQEVLRKPHAPLPCTGKMCAESRESSPTYAHPTDNADAL